MAKIIYVTDRHIRLRGSDSVTVWKGTIDELVHEVFGYTLECGHSWNSKVNMNPKSANALVNALNKASEASCRYYQSDYYMLSSSDEIAAFETANTGKSSRSYRLPQAA